MSAAPVFSAASIAGCIFTVLVSIALPVAALAVLKRKTGRGQPAAACVTFEDGQRRDRQCDGNQHRKNASCTGGG